MFPCSKKYCSITSALIFEIIVKNLTPFKITSPYLRWQSPEAYNMIMRRHRATVYLKSPEQVKYFADGEFHFSVLTSCGTTSLCLTLKQNPMIPEFVKNCLSLSTTTSGNYKTRFDNIVCVMNTLSCLFVFQWKTCWNSKFVPGSRPLCNKCLFNTIYAVQKLTTSNVAFKVRFLVSLTLSVLNTSKDNEEIFQLPNDENISS